MKSNQTNINQNSQLSVILGGGGKTGRRVADRLSTLGHPIRLASRSTKIPFDWNDHSTWPDALCGASAAYIAYAPDLAVPAAKTTIQALIEAAIEHDVRHLVLLSGRGEPEAQACEKLIQESGLDWTIVRASWFNQNFSEGEFSSMIQDGLITLPGGDVKEPFVDANDIADVVTAALTEPGHTGQVYEVTGPRLLSFTDVAAEISAVSGRTVNYQEVPKEAFIEALADAGESADMLWLLDYLFETLLDGRNAQLADGVQRALGRPPRDFTEFAKKAAITNRWRQVA